MYQYIPPRSFWNNRREAFRIIAYLTKELYMEIQSEIHSIVLNILFVPVKSV